MSTRVPYNSTEIPRQRNVTASAGTDFDLKALYFSFFIIFIVLIVVGTVLNLWFLVTILRSEQLRSRLRNKIICTIFVQHLVDTMVLLPVGAAILHFTIGGQFYSCHLYSFASILWAYQDFIANWLLVMVIVVFIAQIVNFDLKTKFTPRAIRIGTWGLLIVPWVLSFLIVLITVYGYHSDVLKSTSGCVYIPTKVVQIFRIVDTIVPVSLMTIFLMIAAFLKHKGLTFGGSDSSMLTVLVDGTPATDNILTYVVAVIVAIVCDLVMVISTLYPSILNGASFRTM